MTISVEVVVLGVSHESLTAAVEAARNGKRVLLISTGRGTRVRRRIREARRAAGVAVSRIRILTGVQVECVAGVRSVEAVLARHIETGRRVDINAASFLAFEDETTTKMSNRKKEKRNVVCSGR